MDSSLVEDPVWSLSAAWTNALRTMLASAPEILKAPTVTLPPPAMATLMSAGVLPIAASRSLKDLVLGSEPFRKSAPLKLNFWSLTPPSVSGSCFSRSTSALNEGRTNEGMAWLPSADGLASAGTEASTDGAAEGAALAADGDGLADATHAASMRAAATHR